MPVSSVPSLCYSIDLFFANDLQQSDIQKVAFWLTIVFATECSICSKRVAVPTLKTFSFLCSLLSASRDCASSCTSALFTEDTTAFLQAPVAAARK